MSTMEELLRNSPNGLLSLRIGAVFASSVGFLAMVLAMMGLYGVIAYSVVQRAREIGLGLVRAYLVTRALGALLIGVRVTDVSVVAAGLAIVTLASAFGPARRASRIDPVTALNREG
jgi:ABC-type antimicrobial peptide transport system permease subunit